MRETNSLDSSLPTADATIPFPYEIRFVDTDTSEAARDQIEVYLARLTHFYDRITFARVNVRVPHKHGHKRLYHIHVEVDMPGRLIAVSREPEVTDKHLDIRTAIRDAFHKVTRQVESFNKERKHHKGHASAAPEITSL